MCCEGPNDDQDFVRPRVDLHGRCGERAEERGAHLEECGTKQSIGNDTSAVAGSCRGVDAELNREYAKLMDRLKDGAAKGFACATPNAHARLSRQALRVVSSAAEGGGIRPAIQRSMRRPDSHESATKQLDDKLNCKEGTWRASRHANPNKARGRLGGNDLRGHPQGAIAEGRKNGARQK